MCPCSCVVKGQFWDSILFHRVRPQDYTLVVRHGQPVSLPAEHLTGLVSILCKARAAMPAGKRPWEDIALWAGVFWALPCG